MSAVVVKNVTINYRVGDFQDIGIKEFFMRKITKSYYEKSFVAVDDVSFSLEKGDILGIVGVNGAGKSTLLKAISGIIRPASGSISVKGRIASLLELSTGFDKDLTVKENAYLRGAILQYTRAFMESHYDEIIDFADLKAFEDRPFRQLSTGMKSRLAFSVSSMMNPDILILDEVLSVGDGAFRKKSQDKMRELMNGGAVSIIVSHSLEQIKEISNKVLWLDRGKTMAFGDSKDVCKQYKQFLFNKK